MTRPSQRLSEHYALRLASPWQDWFDRAALAVRLPGAMRHVVTVDELLADAPSQIWPGFMLPDTLPLVGNDYGDWICVRVGAEGDFEELLYWYHGGGDWIPVGKSLAEAIAHDVVDQFRSVRVQMLRGASESRIGRHFSFIDRFADSDLQAWMTEQLSATLPAELVRNDLNEITDMLAAEDYPAALGRLRIREWAAEAVACDWVELYLQSPIQPLAKKELAASLGIAWYPDYVNMLFDASLFPEPWREQILSKLPDLEAWPEQAWSAAAGVAEAVVQRRSDMGWAHTVLGWQQERSGDRDAAQQIYWQGRMASSFADQAVRFNCHAMVEELGKFCLTRLVEHAGSGLLPKEYLTDPYLAHFTAPRQRSLLSEIYTYWRHQAQELLAAGDAAGTYRALFRAGWDLGVSRLSEYEHLLQDLATAAQAAGWEARSRVAATHYRCLKRRVS